MVIQVSGKNNLASPASLVFSLTT